MTIDLGEQVPLLARVATAEDIVLIKLQWYRLGDEVSQRQWSDLIQVVRLQAGQLDKEYLGRWVEELGVADLLERVWATCEGDG